MTNGYVSGVPSWVSLMARDLGRATDFYGPLLGWRFEAGLPRWGQYIRAFSGDTEVAGLSEASHEWNFPVAWSTYFATDNPDATATAVKENGGTLAVGPLNFAAGRMALAADPAGASFGIMSSRLPPLLGHDVPGSPAWIELRTRDAFESALFYGKVFAWDHQDSEQFEVRWENDRVVLRWDGRNVAALRGGGTEAAADPRIRPRWHVFFSVADVDRALEHAQRLGGEITGFPRDSAYGRVAGLRDPEGALFSLIGHQS